MVLAASTINYLGPFEASYRKRLVDENWKKILNGDEGIEGSPEFDFCDIIGDIERIQKWQL